MRAGRLLGAALAVLGLMGCASRHSDEAPVDQAQQSSAAVSSGRQVRGMRYRGGIQTAANPVCASPHLSYFGGPILQSPTIIGVFWSSSVNATLKANIGQFYADVTQSSYWSWLHEYDTVGLSSGTNQAILPGTYGGDVTITPLKCAPGGANCRLADTDIQSELTRQIGLGNLPAPTTDCTGNSNTIYMVHFPPNISLSGPLGSGRSCAAGGFCAYHNTGTYGPNNTPLIYGALMDYFTGPCSVGCGASPTGLANSTFTASHELVEAVTDPDIGLDTQANYAAPAGWGDNNNGCGEIADICDDGSAGDTITVSGRSWAVTQLWSNAQGKCTSTGTPPAVCSGTTTTNCRKCSCGDNGQACSGATPYCETQSTSALYGACQACTASNSCAGGALCDANDTCVSNCPASCPALDQCHDVGACIPADGGCTQPALPDGTACDAGFACEQATCQAGVCTTSIDTCACLTDSDCPPPGPCMASVHCLAPGGTCQYTPKSDGTPCDDGSACTQGETCLAGSCTNPTSTVTCAPLDGCHLAGSCDPLSGQCSTPLVDAGSACGDAGLCDATGACLEPDAGAGTVGSTSGGPTTSGPSGSSATSTASSSAGSTGAGSTGTGSTTSGGSTASATSTGATSTSTSTSGSSSASAGSTGSGTTSSTGTTTATTGSTGQAVSTAGSSSSSGTTSTSSASTGTVGGSSSSGAATTTGTSSATATSSSGTSGTSGTTASSGSSTAGSTGHPGSSSTSSGSGSTSGSQPKAAQRGCGCGAGAGSIWLGAWPLLLGLRRGRRRG